MKRQILIVDDEENVWHMLTELLSDEGYGVDTARNGERRLKLKECNVR